MTASSCLAISFSTKISVLFARVTLGGNLNASNNVYQPRLSTHQKKGVANLLRVDKKFRTHGPKDEKNEYHKRSHIEAVNSFLKTQYSMAMNKVRGLSNTATYALKAK